MLKLYDNKVN